MPKMDKHFRIYFLYFICLYFGSIEVIGTYNLDAVDKTCEEMSYVLESYDPITFNDIFKSVDTTKALKEVLKVGEIVRVSGFGYLSPSFYYVECLDEMKYLQSKHEINLNTNQFNTQPAGFLYSCGISCSNIKVFSNDTWIHFGMSNNTCYCVDDHDLSAVVDDKYCSDDYANKFNTSNYISVYTTFSPFGNTIEHSLSYTRLCQYAVRTSVGGVDLVHGQCNLPVDGVVCDVPGNYSSLGCSDVSAGGQSRQCVIHEKHGNFSHAKKLCEQYHGNVANDPDLNNILSVVRENKDDKLYALNGHRELLYYNTHKNGTTCISLILQAGGLFLLNENCNISRRYLCAVDSSGLIVFLVFTLILSFCIIFLILHTALLRICKLCKSKEISLEINDRNAHRPISLQDQETNEDSVPGRITADSVSGRLHNTDSVSGRMADGSVSGSVDGGSVPGRQGNGYILTFSSDDSDG